MWCASLCYKVKIIWSWCWSIIDEHSISFKEKLNILEESLKPNFDKEKICKENGIGKTCLYKILQEKTQF